MKKNIIILVLVLFIFILMSSFFWLYEASYFVGRASVSSTSFSVTNSYLFVTPLRAKANGVEKVRLTVFLLNGQGLGVMGKKVIVSPDSRLKIDELQPTTDQNGKAFFDITSNYPGEYFLEVKVDDRSLSQPARLSFY